MTEKQRDYLNGQHEPPNDNAEYQMRSKIRARTEGALSDFFEVNKLSDDDVEKLFEGAGEISTKGTGINRPEGSRDLVLGFDDCLSAIIALACRGYQKNEIDPQKFVSSIVVPGVRKGVADAEDINTSRVSVDIDTTVTILDELTELQNRLEQEGPASLSDKEGFLLYKSREIDSAELKTILDSSDE